MRPQFKMLKVISLLLVSILLIVTVEAQYCRYQRFSSVHTFCLPKNNSCNVLDRGITLQERAHILKLHNEYRSKIAMGQEQRAGGMPQAANMLELVWDDELAEVAQSLSDSCRYGHDCKPCRMVPRFIVGQNLARIPGSRYLVKADWDQVIGYFYNEVQHFDKDFVGSFVQSPSDKRIQYGHFSQLIWAKTWRIGCGWTLYEEARVRKSYFACNFGPGGNVNNAEVYKAGAPCSACPANTCCGQSCRGQPTYPGLCKVINENIPPEGNSPHYGNELFYCNFNDDRDCSYTVEGPNNWQIIRSNGGSWIEAVLTSGQNSTLRFRKRLRPSSEDVCFRFVSRRGPNVANTTYSNELTMLFQFGRQVRDYSVRIPPENVRHMFITSQYPVVLPMDTDVYFSVNFYVPPSSPPQFVQLEKIIIQDKSCFY